MHSMKRDSWEQAYDDWCLAIGKFMLWFASIEESTFVLLKELPTENIFEATISLQFGQRVDLLLAVASDSNKVMPSTKNALIEKLKLAKNISEKRNLVAHNPLSVDIYKHKSEEEYKIVERIRSLKNQKKVIEIEELRELGVNTKKLALELNDLVNEVLVANA